MESAFQTHSQYTFYRNTKEHNSGQINWFLLKPWSRAPPPQALPAVTMQCTGHHPQGTDADSLFSEGPGRRVPVMISQMAFFSTPSLSATSKSNLLRSCIVKSSTDLANSYTYSGLAKGRRKVKFLKVQWRIEEKDDTGLLCYIFLQ